MFFQFLKFALVGVANTAVDFFILNSLMWIFKIYSGWPMFFFNVTSFSAAVINSYFLNKYWTFSNTQKERVAAQFAKFFLISVVGATVNSSIVYFGTTFLTPAFGLSSVFWANGVKAVAVIASLIWNFAGYKRWVFTTNNK